MSEKRLEDIRYSSSKMGSYEWCEQKFYIREIEEIPSPYPLPPELSDGRISHNLVSDFFKNFYLDKSYEKDIRSYYNNVINKTDSEKVKICFNNFLEFQILRVDRYKTMFNNNLETIRKYFFPVINERYIKIKYTKYEFAGVIDSAFRIVNKNPNQVIIIDWKTDKVGNHSAFMGHIPQLKRYSSLIKRLGYDCMLYGIFFLFTSLFFKSVRDQDYNLKEELLTFVRTLRESDFKLRPKKEYWKCRICEYKDLCGRGHL